MTKKKKTIYSIILMMIFSICLSVNAYANNSNFHGQFYRTLTTSYPDQETHVDNFYIVDDINQMNGACNTIYLPTYESSALYSSYDCDNDYIDSIISISGFTIYYEETGYCDGVAGECWSAGVTILFSNDYSSATYTGFFYDESDKRIGTITGTHTRISPAIYSNPTSLALTLDPENTGYSQTFNVRNSGGEKISYSIRADDSWLTCTPNSGSSTGEEDTITVNYDPLGLSEGIHTATISISDPDADNSPFEIPVTLTIIDLCPGYDDSLDADSDGVPDCMDNDDTDGDGFTDAEEVICGSDPADFSSRCSRGLPWLMLILDD